MILFFKKNRDILILLIPGLIAFIIASIPTLNYGWPLSGDIFYHVHMAKLYMEQGFTYWDPLTCAPFGRPIFYPPLFHFLIAGLTLLFNANPFNVARILQPILAMSVILSFSYIAYKFNNLLVGISVGFFIMFSVFFQRFMLALPENVALILFPIVIYYFYKSIQQSDYKYALISGILAGSILLIHALSAICLFLVVLTFVVMIKILRKQPVGYCFSIFLGCAALIASIWWLPLIIQYGILFKNVDAYSVSIFAYPNYFGTIPLIFAFFGGILMLKRRKDKDILIFSWLISIIIFSELYLVNIPVLSNRILTFAVFPLMTMAGLGLEYFKIIFKKININKKFFYMILSIIYIGAIFSGLFMLNGFNNAPSPLRASDSELEVAEWFNDHGDKKSVVVAPDFRDTFIVSISGQPVAMGGYGQGLPTTLNLQKYATGKANKSDFIRDKVGYIVLRLGMKKPPYTKVVYQNKDFKICMFENINS